MPYDPNKHPSREYHEKYGRQEERREAGLPEFGSGGGGGSGGGSTGCMLAVFAMLALPVIAIYVFT